MHRFHVGGVLAFGDAVLIMHLLRTVEAKAYAKALCCQKLAPVLIKKGAVCLNSIDDAYAGWLVLPLEGHNRPEIFRP